MAAKYIIEARGLGKNIRDNEILKGINLSITSGELISIIGASGSGKSTLLYLLGLLDMPTTGEIVLEGRAVDFTDDETLSVLRNQYIGFVFQFHYLISELSAAENIMVPMFKNGKDLISSRKRADELLTELGLGGLEDRKPYELSGGEQQRVAVARALANEPTIIFADEPTGNLDSKNTAKVMNTLKELNQRGTSILLVTHELDLAAETTRTIELMDGEIIRETLN